MIKNFLQIPMQQITSHDGVGKIDIGRVLDASDFATNCNFFDRIVIPPNSSIGYHRHANNEELYIILEGRGTMTINQEEIVVKRGDVIKNPPFGEHGLVNDSDTDMHLLIMEMRVAD